MTAEALRPEDIDSAELHLGGTPFPDDYRDWLLTTNGQEAWFGEIFVMLYSLDEAVAVTRAAEPDDRLPGLLAFGSDGGGELLAFDLRRRPPPVVLVNTVSAGWHEGLFQAPSFSAFMAQRDASEPFRWDEPYV